MRCNETVKGVLIMAGYKNILFCTDFSEDANMAFVQAFELAKRDDAKLHIIHIPHSPYAYCRHIVDEHIPEGISAGETFYDDEIERRALAALKKVYGVKMKDFRNFVYIIKMGSPDVEILRYARKNQVDLIVMGCRGKFEKDRFDRGSAVEKVAKYAHCHVIPVRSPAKRFTLPAEMY